MKLNRKPEAQYVTGHNGYIVKAIPAAKQLERLVLANLLWEDQFYVDGKTAGEQLAELVKSVAPSKVSELAVKARSQYKLRHVPLLLTRELARAGRLSADTLDAVVQRPDEMGEFLSLYWKDGRQPVSNQVKKGLAKAFSKFNEYELAKWDKNDAAVRMRDVMFISHPKPANAEQEALFKRVAEDKLKTPDTWETQLSAGADKGETFVRLMAARKLGALAFLRNLRNMVGAGISETIIRDYAKNVDVTRILPFRYIAAARQVPQLEDMLEDMVLRSLATVEKLPGKTVLLVDVSGSMFGTKVSSKSDLDRFDAAAALAMLCREICEEVEVYTFSNHLVRVAPRRGFAMRDALYNSQPRSGTDLIGSIAHRKFDADRMIVFTDEQIDGRRYGDYGYTWDVPKMLMPTPQGIGLKRGYVLNVGSYENGINHDKWETITGFSEASIDYIRLSEKE